MKRSRAIALTAVLLSSAAVFAQNHAQAAPQAQESNAQKLLMDSIEKLDVTGVKAALGKGADLQWASGTENKMSVIAFLAFMSADWQDMRVEHPEQRAVEILQVLLKAGAKIRAA